jgi:hypothetical protein
LTLAPKNNQEPYLQFVGEVTKVLINVVNREKILSSSGKLELYSAITTAV